MKAFNVLNIIKNIVIEIITNYGLTAFLLVSSIILQFVSINLLEENGHTEFIKKTIEVLLHQVVIIFMLIATVLGSIKILTISSFETFLKNTISVFFSLSLMVYFIALFGDELLQIMNEKTVETLFLVTVSLLFLFIYLIMRRDNRDNFDLKFGKFSLEPSSTSSARRKINEIVTEKQYLDDKTTAIHELGHLLVLTPFHDVIELSVSILNDENTKTFGRVTFNLNKNFYNYQPAIEILMLCYLAGSVAEKKFQQGLSSMGAVNDSKTWLNYSHVYLSNFIEGVYYNEVDNDAQEEINHKIRNELFNKQKIILELFLSKIKFYLKNCYHFFLIKKS